VTTNKVKGFYDAIKDAIRDDTMFLSKLFDFAGDGADILFPRRCAVCGAKLFGSPGKKICGDCGENIFFLHNPVCRVCGRELGGDSDRDYLCGTCLGDPPPYALARSVVRYSAPVRKLLYGLKYGNDTSVMSGIGEITSSFDMSLFDRCDYIIPVPLYPVRLRRRGLNQSVLLAKIFFRKQPDTVLNSNSLLRIRNTIPQTDLDGRLRRKNLKGAFSLSDKSTVSGSTVCLVDDVFTTGTTVSECSRVLLCHGVKEVRVITLARVVLSHRGR
jgi:ComF family protein